MLVVPWTAPWHPGHVGSVVGGRHSVALALDHQPVDEAGSQNVLAKALLLQQLEGTERGARVTAVARISKL